jgi:hypothetical protein
VSHGGAGRNPVELLGQGVLGAPQIERILHVEPKLRTVAAVLSEPRGHFGCHPAVASEDLVELLSKSVPGSYIRIFSIQPLKERRIREPGTVLLLILASTR